MCGGITDMQSRRAPRRQLHQEMKPNILQLPDHWRHQPPAAPAGLAIVASLVQSAPTTSRTKPAESAPISPTSSLPIPISSSSSSSAAAAANQKINNANPHNNNNNNREDNHFPAYFKKNSVKISSRGTTAPSTSIFSTSLSPPLCSYDIMSCSSCSRGQLSHDFLGLCLSCNRPLPPGKDIYMYRGDRAFCSMECRNKHIVADESLLCNIQINQQCVQSSSPTNQPKLKPPVVIAILV